MLTNGLKIYFNKMRNNAIIPTYANPGDCCCDLYSTDNVTIKPGERKLIDTGISIELPEGFEAQIRPRSGLAWKHGITVLNSPGTIDEQYRNSIKVLLINHGTDVFTVTEGDRIAQMKFSPTYTGYFLESVGLSDTKRGMSGFGDSGMR